MKIVLGRLWATWAIIWFVASLFIILIPTIITRYAKEPFKSNFFYKLSRFWMQLFLNGVLCPLKVIGTENFRKGENYIVTANHNTFLDVPVTSPFIPSTNKTIAKNDFLKIPIFNFIYERGGVLIDRKSEASRRKGYEDMKNVLERGWHMCIYPEGTRNKTKEPLQPFKDGAFKLAIETDKCIMPCLLFNTAKAMPIKPSFCLYPHRLQMHFLAPISPKGETIESLKQKVFDVMKKYYEMNYA
jgi:1-acyl-sn-glycerol-3-phosphate acyltransferase